MKLRLHRKNTLLTLIVLMGFSIVLYSLLWRTSGEAKPGSRDEVRKIPQVSAGVSTKRGFPLLSGSLTDMRKSVYENNFQQKVLNMNTDHIKGDLDLVLVVQVHNRPAYLRMFLESLRQAADVERILLVLSLDYLSEELEKIIHNVTFCRVVQICFPYSLQLYPEEFPGQDPADCPRDISKADALQQGCKNAEYPDSFGHYREAVFTQTKHHWWWKLHFVWERLEALHGYSGHAIFLEEDNYVLPDFVPFFKEMEQLQKKQCPECHILALGSQEGLPAEKQSISGVVDIISWKSTKHNLGMGMNRQVYYILMGCSREFCAYDDYNWDWTLQHLSANCLTKPLKVMVPQLPRLFHTGDCGMHQSEACDPDFAFHKMKAIVESSGSHLFPKSLTVGINQEAVGSPPAMKNGGWGDVRDHALCNSYSKL
ncbi:alpha-1,6-mannosyl-glycoprotein 2-beta-N-acetylglucosaminyltransferase-like [Protopterus annectens]|uniref:alpha-1,6-mannosyl-glycoprotein 2-beta-N-acetylglucosaminyltransferase-like n=1 Tax=Protopterus annectens TaxID=7888 RepID=UPI001CFB318A|nr:alpha-1,6-mannosyl-glycoprotein 2-beta-N-acetylglucosaminyltransferase-like [Protopterus annectens]